MLGLPSLLEQRVAVESVSKSLNPQQTDVPPIIPVVKYVLTGLVEGSNIMIHYNLEFRTII